jgi:predicted nucleic acid-binding protein
LRIYLDSSFVASLYISDRNTRSAAPLLHKAGHAYVVSRLGEFETINALQLRVYLRESSPAQAQAALENFTSDLRDGVLTLNPLPEGAFDRALQLSRQNTARMGTQSADILHVAAALELGCDAIYSFDQQQRKLARAVGLKLN